MYHQVFYSSACAYACYLADGMSMCVCMFSGQTDEAISVGFGFAAHLVYFTALFLHLPLRYPIIPRGSRSMLKDNISDASILVDNRGMWASPSIQRRFASRLVLLHFHLSLQIPRDTINRLRASWWSWQWYSDTFVPLWRWVTGVYLWMWLPTFLLSSFFLMWCCLIKLYVNVSGGDKLRLLF